MGVVAKTSLTLRFGYLEFREQGFALFYLIYFTRKVKAAVRKGLRNLRKNQDLLTKH